MGKLKPWEQDWVNNQNAGQPETQAVVTNQSKPEIGRGQYLAEAAASVVPRAGLGLVDMAIGLGDIAGSLASQWTGLGDGTGKLRETLRNDGGVIGLDTQKAREVIDSLHSEGYRSRNQKVADAKGFVDTTKAYLSNPEVAVNQIAEQIPSMFIGGAAGKGAQAAAAVRGLKMSDALVGAVGEGIVGAGQSAAQIQQETGGLNAGQAGFSLLSGAATAGLGLLGGKAAQKLGVSDVDTALAAGSLKPMSDKVEHSVAKSALKGAISEGLLEELPQSVSEQILQNVATGREWDEDLGSAAAQGMIMGGAMGAGMAGTSAAIPKAGALWQEYQEQRKEKAEQGQTVDADVAAKATEAVLQQEAAKEQAQDVSGSLNADGEQAANVAQEDVVQEAEHTPIDTVSGSLGAETTSNALPEPETVQTDTMETASAPVARKLSEQMGLDANAGALSAAAVVAVDSGAANVSAVSHVVNQAASADLAHSAHAPVEMRRQDAAVDGGILPPIKNVQYRDENYQVPAAMAKKTDRLRGLLSNQADGSGVSMRKRFDAMPKQAQKAFEIVADYQADNVLRGESGEPSMLDNYPQAFQAAMTVAKQFLRDNPDYRDVWHSLSMRTIGYRRNVGWAKPLASKAADKAQPQTQAAVNADSMTGQAVNAGAKGVNREANTVKPLAKGVKPIAQEKTQSVDSSAKNNQEAVTPLSNETAKTVEPEKVSIQSDSVAQVQAKNVLAPTEVSKQPETVANQADKLPDWVDVQTVDGKTKRVSHADLSNANVKNLTVYSANGKKTAVKIGRGKIQQPESSVSGSQDVSATTLNQATAKKADKLVGKNKSGYDVFERDDGSRYQVDGRIVIVEPRRLVLSQNGVGTVNLNERSNDFKTVDELNQEQQEQSDEPSAIKQTGRAEERATGSGEQHQSERVPELAQHDNRALERVASENGTRDEKGGRAEILRGQSSSRHDDDVGTLSRDGNAATGSTERSSSGVSTAAARELSEKDNVENKVKNKEANTQPKQDDGKNSRDVAADSGVSENANATEPNQKQIDDFIDKALSQNDPRGELPLWEVSAREVNLIKQQADLDVSGLMHVLDAQELKHALRKHHNDKNEVQKQAQENLTAAHLKRIPQVLREFDEIEVQKRSTNRSSLIYKKSFGDGTIEYVERVFETSAKKNPRLSTKTVWVVSPTAATAATQQVYTPERQDNHTSKQVDKQADNQPAAGVLPEQIAPEFPNIEQETALPETQTKVADSQNAPSQSETQDFTIDDDNAHELAGAKTKFKQNVAAIETLKTLMSENREATAQEQKMLAKWVGWGGLANAFRRADGSMNKGWEAETQQLENLLTAEELSAARESALTAFYTPAEVVKAMWQAVERMGFKGGRVLEPSVGSGSFIGLMPKGLRQSTLMHGAELDTITGNLAKKLYPKAKIQVMGFENYAIPDGYFRLAIGNPPFGGWKITDKTKSHLNGLAIHNYFFAKSVDALEDNGMLAMVVTNNFMDASDRNDKARAYIAQNTELLGAVRLPNNAFQKNAGTSVTTDVIFLRKLTAEERAAGVRVGAEWNSTTTHTDKNGNQVPLNVYFANNPDMMLGEFGAFSGMYGGNTAALVANKGQNTAKLLESALQKLPENVFKQPEKDSVELEHGMVQTIPDVKVGSLIIDNGVVLKRFPDVLGEKSFIPVDDLPTNAMTIKRIAGMIDIREVLANVRKLQLTDNVADGVLTAQRKKLNEVYDAFVKKYGYINSQTNKRLFADDPSYPQLSALEENYDKGISAEVAKKTGQTARKPSAQKAAIFSKRTQYPVKHIEKVDSAKDGLLESLEQLGRVDIKRIAQKYGKEADDVIAELGSLVYEDPALGWQTAEQYLSGNVKAKLVQAKEAAKSNPAFMRNVSALQAVIPEDIEAADILVRLGASWLPESTMNDFLREVAGGNWTGESGIRLNKPTAEWSLANQLRVSPDAQTRFGTSRRDVKDVIDAAINGKTLNVYDKVHENGQERNILNQEATDEVNAKIDELKRAFEDWIWQDDSRRETLSRLYNDIFNTDVQPNYDGSHLTLSGKIDDAVIALRPTQKNAVWRITQNQNTLLDHVVGAGKTFTMVAAAMELRRMGLATKPMIIVPNHLVGQWGKEFAQLYPNANILVAGKKDFEKANRKRLVGRIANGDWDAVIVGHSSFEKVPVSKDYQVSFMEDEIAEISAAIEEANQRDGKGSSSAKDMERRLKILDAKMTKLLESKEKDEDNLLWEELGVDALFVDEAHEFKNLGFVSSMQRVAGLGNQSGSQKAMDLYLKIKQMQENSNSRVVFATGTPISNSMTEMYTMQRYLDGKRLEQQGLNTFDAWAKNFGEVVNDWELSASGTYKMKSRFAKFVNMPELMQSYLSFADVINRDDINESLKAQGKTLPVPKIKGGKPENVIVPRSDFQAAYIGEADKNGIYPSGSLVYRSEHLPKGKAATAKGADNMLRIVGEARKLALDPRILDANAPDFENSKINTAAKRIFEIYKKWDKEKGTQLVFSDLSTPKSAVAKEQTRVLELQEQADLGDANAMAALEKYSPDELDSILNANDFDAYNELKRKLIALGMPEKEIAFIHDANTDLQKEELFGKVKSGMVRVLIGSTSKMGAGTNVQNRLVALHHLDAPWRPSDLEQREGRIIRQGNELRDADPEHFEVEILRYATEKTMDAMQWQIIENKAKFIGQVRKGDTKSRVVEDIDGETANAAQMKAASSGNPLILEEMSLRKQIQDLENDKNRHDKQQHRIKSMQRKLLAEIANSEMRLIEIDRLMSVPVSPEFDVKVGKAQFKQGQEKARENSGAMILQKMNSGLIRKIGSFGEFDLLAGRDDFGFKVVLAHGGAEIAVPFDSNANAGGVLMRLQNAIDKLPENKEKLLNTIAKNRASLPKLESQLQEWGKNSELEALRQQHKDVLEALKPKKEQQANNQAADQNQEQEAVQDVSDNLNDAENTQFDLAIAQLTPPENVQQHIDKTREMVRRVVGDANMSHVDVISRVDALKHFVKGKHYDLDTGMQIAMGVRGWHDSKTGKVFIVAEHDNFIQNPSWAAFTAWHELGHAKVNVSGRTEWQETLVDAYERNATVRALVDKKMAAAHGKYRDLNVATEEAIVELFAAFKTGNYAAFKQRNNGIAFPIVPTRNFLQRVIQALQDIVRRVLGKQVALSNEQLMGLLGKLDNVDLNAGKGSGSLNFDLNESTDLADAEFARKAAVLQGAPVYTITERTAPRTNALLRQWAMKLFEQAGGKAVNPEIGEVVLNEKSVRDSLAHGLNPAKAMAFEAVPSVIEKGVVITQTTHGDMESYFISAPVEILRVDDIVTVLVRKDMNTQRMYLHSVTAKENLLNKALTGLDSDSTAVKPRGKLYSGDVASVLRNYLNFKPESADLSSLNDDVSFDFETSVVGVNFNQWSKENPIENFADELGFDEDAYVNAWIKADMAAMDKARAIPKQQIEAYEKAKIDGKTELTLKQWAQVRSPEFKRWFGDWENDPQNASKVINPRTGEPLVVYHGTPNSFTKFSTVGLNTSSVKAGAGFFFTSDFDVAKTYMRSRDWNKHGEMPSNFNPMPLFLNIRNMAVSDFDGNEWDNLPNPKSSDLKDTQALSANARKHGFDGTRFDNVVDSATDKQNKTARPTTVFTVFKPSNIKSAINNVGTFDPSNDDIRFDMATTDTPQQRNRAMSNLINAVSFSGSLKDLKPKNMKQSVADKWTDALKISLQALGRRQIVDIYGKLLPQLHAYDELVDRFGADDNKTAMKADELVIKWGKLKDADKLADLMHEATIAQVDADPLKKSDMISARVAAENWLSEMDKRLEAAEQEANEEVDAEELEKRRRTWQSKSIALEAVEKQLADAENESGDSAMSENVTDVALKQVFFDAERLRGEVKRAENEYTELRDKAERSQETIQALKKKQAAAEERYNKAMATEQQLDDFHRRFNALSDDAKSVYRQARDDYKQQFEYIQAAMKARLKRLGIERKDVFESLDEKFAKGLNGVYFPLSRFGQYVVVVRDADGKPISVSRAESMKEARQLQADLQAQFPDNMVEKPVLSKEFNQSRDGVGRGFLQALRDEVNKNAKLDSTQLEFIEDALTQLYFQSLPDLSWAKHGIHRKNRAGYSDDARRAYAQSMSSGASYLAKLRYGDLLQAELDNMQAHTDSLKNTDEQPVAQRVVDEMVKRHENMMNPKPNALSTGLTSFGFLWYLGLSPASALVNLSQTALVAYPVMAAKWGYKKAAAELVKASRQTYTNAKKPTVKLNGWKPSITGDGWNDISGSLNDDELAAYHRAVDDGTIDISQAHDLAGVASGEDSGAMWRFRGVMRSASWLFHQAERFNRQVTFVAAYRLAKQSGVDSETAFNQAKKATYDGHFDYSASNRPRFMQGNVARVVFLFKQYSQNMIYMLARNAYQAAKGDKEARKAMAGLLTMHAAAAGVLGLPMVTTLLAAASWLGSDDDEPWDAETALRNQLAEIFGDKGSEILAKGLSRATPWDISGRVGLDKLIFPDVQEGLGGKRWAESFSAGLAGPVVGLGINWANGSQKLTQGDYGQALEAFMPVAIRSPLKALRLGVNGMQDSSGVMIKDDFNAAELIGQAAGFSASDARLAQESKSAVYQADRRLQARRAELLAMFAKAQMAGDGDKVREVRESIVRWNGKHPSRQITVPQMIQSVRNRQKRINEAKHGIYLSNNRQDARAAGAFGVED